MSSRMEDAAVEPRTVDEARNAVEQSRQRISSTLDALEDRIVEKKHEIQDKVDVFRPVKEQVRQRPFTAVAVAVGVGALLGSLGGSDDEEEESRSRRRTRSRARALDHDDDGRRELREWRKQRRERLRARARHHDDDRSSRMDGIKHQLMGAVTAAISTAISSRLKEMARGTRAGGGHDRVERHDRLELRDDGRFER